MRKTHISRFKNAGPMALCLLARLHGPSSAGPHGESRVTWDVVSNPEGPCTVIVYIWAPKLLYRNPFKAQVYTRWVLGPLGKELWVRWPQKCTSHWAVRDGVLGFRLYPPWESFFLFVYIKPKRILKVLFLLRFYGEYSRGRGYEAASLGQGMTGLRGVKR